MNTTGAGNILIVDDEITNLKLLGAMLHDLGYAIRPAVNGRQAIEAARLSPPDLILLDVMLPDLDGYEVCAAIKAEETLADIPIIFLSALNEPFNKVRAFEVGGQDYITKPFHVEEVIARVRTNLENARLRLRDQEHMAQLKQYITERETGEHRQIELALEKERIHLLTTFMRDAAHEFRTPLAVIKTSAYIVANSPDPDKRLQYVNNIEQSAEQIAQLVEAMLAVIRTNITSLPPQLIRTIYWNDIVTMMATKVKDRLASHALTLRLDLQPDLPTLRGDYDGLCLAFQHILDNAIKFTGPGGTIRVSTRSAPQALSVTIADTGTGIRAEDLPHIFDHFFRADKSHTSRGLGLGLPIARTVLDYHQAQIAVETAEGQGSAFTLIFPLNGPEGSPEG